MFFSIVLVCKPIVYEAILMFYMFVNNILYYFNKKCTFWWIFLRNNWRSCLVIILTLMTSIQWCTFSFVYVWFDICPLSSSNLIIKLNCLLIWWTFFLLWCYNKTQIRLCNILKIDINVFRQIVYVVPKTRSIGFWPIHMQLHYENEIWHILSI